MDSLYDSAGAFVLVTLVLGGGAAWLTGRAIARTWRPVWQAILFMLMLGAAVRFIHFALFNGTLTSAPAYALDTGIAIVLAVAGFRLTRARQMARQYGFLTACAARQSATRAAGGAQSA